MKITAERFKALFDGTARDVTAEERMIRVEAFAAERRGENPATAVQARMPSSTAHQRETAQHWLYGLALIGMIIIVAWFAASVGMGSLVAHFVGVAVFGLLFQGVVWFFRAPDRS